MWQTNNPACTGLHVQGDFNHWVALLNYFDTFFEEQIKPRQDVNLKFGDSPGGKDDPPFPTLATVAVLKATCIILENCSNKHLYLSYEVKLCCLAVLVHTLKSLCTTLDLRPESQTLVFLLPIFLSSIWHCF